MKIEVMKKSLMTIVGTSIMLASVETLAFIPSQSVVDQWLGAIGRKYAIPPQDLGLEAVRGRLKGNSAAVIYLNTAVTRDPEQPRARMYCTIDKFGSVTQLRANPRLLDTLK